MTSFPPLAQADLAGSYHLTERGELQPTRGEPTPLAQARHAALREYVLQPEFSCVAARASVNTSSYALGLYPPLASPEATHALASDLGRFLADQDALDSGFTSFVATFSGPPPADEAAFERTLWAQLRALHEADPAPYSAEVSPDPQSAQFGFSFGGRGFFVIGLHPGSSRLARRFPFTALVFNAHRQFRGLRESGRFDRMQATIRTRELGWQGSLNPNLANYGEASEARQYSGRAVEPDWVAPFPAAPAPGSQPRPPAREAGPGSPRTGGCPFGHGAPGGTVPEARRPEGTGPADTGPGLPARSGTLSS